MRTRTRWRRPHCTASSHPGWPSPELTGCSPWPAAEQGRLSACYASFLPAHICPKRNRRSGAHHQGRLNALEKGSGTGCNRCRLAHMCSLPRNWLPQKIAQVVAAYVKDQDCCAGGRPPLVGTLLKGLMNITCSGDALTRTLLRALTRGRRAGLHTFGRHSTGLEAIAWTDAMVDAAATDSSCQSMALACMP